MPGITLVLLYWEAGIIGSCLACCATALGPCNRNCNSSFNLTVLLFSYIPCLSSNLYSVTRETSSHFLLYTLALVLCNYKRLMDIMDFDYFFFFSFWSLFSIFLKDRGREMSYLLVCFSEYPQQPGLVRPKPVAWNTIHVLCEWQGQKYSSHCLLPPRRQINRKQNWEWRSWGSNKDSQTGFCCQNGLIPPADTYRECTF